MFDKESKLPIYSFEIHNNDEKFTSYLMSMQMVEKIEFVAHQPAIDKKRKNWQRARVILITQNNKITLDKEDEFQLFGYQVNQKY